MKKNILLAGLVIVFVIQLIFNYYLWSLKKVPKIHVLERPLQIASEFGNYSEYTILPAGTVLYDDSDSLNRRVKVYFNLQGVDFKFEEQDPEILKQPSEVSSIRVIDLSDMLKSIPLTKKDIYLIIKYDDSVKDSIKPMLFKKYKIDPADFEKDDK